METIVIEANSKAADGIRAIAHGLPVPRIFSTFGSARDYVMGGGSVIARTMHPTEIAGLSGLNHSKILRREDVIADGEDGGLLSGFEDDCEDLFLFRIQSWHKRRFARIDIYCKSMGIDVDTYCQEIACSYWDYIEGLNLYVIQHPNDRDQLRIFFSKSMGQDGSCVYRGQELFSGDTLPCAAFDCLSDIRRLYKDVQSCFGDDHPWVVEMQLSEKGELFFLQRSMSYNTWSEPWRLKDFSDADFIVDPTNGEGEIWGMTPPEGIEMNIIKNLEMLYGMRNGGEEFGMVAIPEHMTVVWQNIIKNSSVYISNSITGHGESMTDPHSSLVPVTRSDVFLCTPSFYGYAELNERGMADGFRCLVKSDGTRASITLL